MIDEKVVTICNEGVVQAEKRGVVWTDEMTKAVENNETQTTPAGAAHMVGLTMVPRKSFPVTAPTFDKAERSAIRSVLMRKVQREEQQLQDESCAALAAEMRSEKKLGRPSEYSPEVADQICLWVAKGKSLNKYCKEFGIGIETIYRWLRTNDTFRERYGQAHDDRADLLADEVIDMLDEVDGKTVTFEMLALLKLKADTRRWMAAKLKPGKWGERQVVQHDHGGVQINIGIPRMSDRIEVVEKIEPPLSLP